MKKTSIYLTITSVFLSLTGMIIPRVSLAVCPLCTFAVVAGLGLSRYLGIDDLISGAWIGALLFSMVVVTRRWFIKKNIHFRFSKIALIIIWYGIVILPLYWSNVMGHPNNRFLGIDKLLFGIVVGSVVFGFADLFHNYLKKKNGDKSYFPFQRVIVPIVALLILSAIFYFIK